MVTKPIGGAAEFVSQTSLGLLQGIGLVDTFRPRYDPGSCPATAIKGGAARYHELVTSFEVFYSNVTYFCYVFYSNVKYFIMYFIQM